MLYYIKYKLSYFNRILKYYACNRIPNRYEVYVLGTQIMSDNGQSVWNGTGAARNAIRLILSRISDYNKPEVDSIMKYHVGLDSSYPIYIKKL